MEGPWSLKFLSIHIGKELLWLTTVEAHCHAQRVSSADCVDFAAAAAAAAVAVAATAVAVAIAGAMEIREV
jgi:hypothetical protein